MYNLVDKYIDLLLNRCINFNNSNSLFISFEKFDEWSVKFVARLIEKSKKLGVNDICVCDESSYEKHDVLKNINFEDIDNHPLFDGKLWNEYAEKGASFLILKTEIPGLMDDIKPELLARARYVERFKRDVYKKLQLSYQIPWCIAVLPSEAWAKSLFPNDKDAYNKLFELICKMTMVDTDNPILSWNKTLSVASKMRDKLTSLKISKLHYTNSLGTNLTIELPDNASWICADKEGMIVNMPSYEIFTTPNFRKTEGIVYSSRPLSYNGGIVDKFYLKFKDGKVVEYDAKEGKEILKGIIESDEQSAFLGEVALVECDSPISKTKMVFRNTLLDENASCHLALGRGFPKCIKNGQNMSDEELLSMGVNCSKNHTDFMIGTDDLNIQAETEKGKILIFKNGKFNF